MPGAVIAALLISSLLLVHFSSRRYPLPASPLNVDDGLPWPEAAQASTVFSLTALFGAYLGIYLILGIPALSGLAAGTVLGLLLLREWIGRRGCESFERFLTLVLPTSRTNAIVFGLLLIGIQVAYATSELLILRELAKTALGFRPEHATLLVLALCVIGYFYVLFGGYAALFRTDVLQFVLIGGMGVVVFVAAVRGWAAGALTLHFWPRPGYWKAPGVDGAFLTCCYQFAVAGVMGFGLIAASPDAWKRVFLVVQKPKNRSRFFVFLAVGVAPFIFLVPMSAVSPLLPDGAIDAKALLAGLLANNTLFIAASLALVASFLSSFDSALLAAVQVGLILRRRPGQRAESQVFHWLMATVLIVIGLSFLALHSIGNPYLLGNALLGPYAIVAGIQIGSLGFVSRLRNESLLWVIVTALLVWFFYFTSGVSSSAMPSTYELNTVPAGVFLCLSVAGACRLLRARRIRT